MRKEKGMQATPYNACEKRRVEQLSPNGDTKQLDVDLKLQPPKEESKEFAVLLSAYMSMKLWMKRTKREV